MRLDHRGRGRGAVRRGCKPPVRSRRPENPNVFLADIPLTFFAVPGHPLAARSDATPVTREQLARFPVFICDARGYLFDLVRNFFDADGLPAPRIQATGSAEGIKRSVMREVLRVGVLPGYALEEELRTQLFALVRVRPNLPTLRLEAMSYRQGPRAHPAVDALVEAVRRHLNAPVRPERGRVPRLPAS